MKIYDAYDQKMRLYGICPEARARRMFYRLPEEMIEKFPQFEELGRRNVGARLRFRTDASAFKIRMRLATESVDPAIALPGSAGLDVYEESGVNSRYLGYLAPSDYGFKEKWQEGEFRKSSGMQTITLNLPRNERLSALKILLPDEANLETAPDYRYEQPIVFYGSSITEGGCAPRPGAAYTSIVSRRLDSDYLNHGYSGGAKGEIAFAEYIAKMENISILVYDYDHNSPSPKHLAETHEPFFRHIRKAKPGLPIVMLSRPDFDFHREDSIRRRDVIYRTYRNAVQAGDRNVYFIDGERLFGTSGREECTIDGCHPTGLGFMRMAEAVYPVLARILESKE